MASGIPVDAISRAIASHGFWVGHETFDAPLLGRLYTTLIDHDLQRPLARAGIGRGATRTLDAGVRGDRIRWFEPGNDAERELSGQLDALRQSLGRALFVSMIDFEAHYAIYAPGEGYQRHVDRLKNDTRRVLSFVLYLNPDWNAADGGELVLYRNGSDRNGSVNVDPPDGPSVELTRVLPNAGTLVVFLSADIPHEVLPAKRPRASIVGWFRQRAER